MMSSSHSNDVPEIGESDSLRRWERWTGHAGYVAQGAVYLLLGGFALFADIRHRRQPDGAQGALTELSQATYGKILLALLAFALAAFVVWHLLLAIVDPEHRGDRTRPRRWLVRLRHLCSGIFYGALVVEAIWILFGWGAVDGALAHSRWSARLLQFPAGRVIVASVGVGIGVFAVTQFYRAVTDDKSKRVDLSHTKWRRLINMLGLFGYVSRSALFALLAVYVTDAAWRSDPRYARGVGGTLGHLRHRQYGVWLLAILATGLMAYGLFQITKERYRLFRNS
jgi:hypothetical protein